jgi:hypothetical protein
MKSEESLKKKNKFAETQCLSGSELSERQFDLIMINSHSNGFEFFVDFVAYS